MTIKYNCFESRLGNLNQNRAHVARKEDMFRNSFVCKKMQNASFSVTLEESFNKFMAAIRFKRSQHTNFSIRCSRIYVCEDILCQAAY